VVVECGWGMLIFAHTFDDNKAMLAEFRNEREHQRDIAIYLRDPHVALARAPQEVFLDPSHTSRLWLDQYRPPRQPPKGFSIRKLIANDDAHRVNRILTTRGMVPIEPGFLFENQGSRILTFLAAVSEDGALLGFVMGVDHVRAFRDPEGGSSLWALAVDPQCPTPGVGEALVRRLAEVYKARGRTFMDLSVMHDNEQAIRLYDKLGFQRVPVFAVKGKNSINERLYVGPVEETGLNPYAQLIVDEARRRGIGVEVLDSENGFFKLSHGGREVICRESLTELTTAIAMSRCDDKAVTRKLLDKEGLRVPAQVAVSGDADIDAFLAENPRIVVKPARGEQGAGITVDVSDPAEVRTAVEAARAHCDKVLLEEFVTGNDLRIIVIDFKVIAGAIRKPARVTGTGRDDIATLIEKQSRRRAAATGGESTIPMDAETERCVAAAGHTMKDVLGEGETLEVRKTANLHTGGTIQDVTDRLHPVLIDAAVRAARAIDIPVVGLDFMVPEITGKDYAIIEANERPGLANHEPQPTAERFIDMLFPQIAQR
jgi:GNAT-family acetyltransferase (TIGR03103 family)